MKKQLSDEEIFSKLNKEYVKVPEGLDQEILSKLKVKKVNLFSQRLKVYSIAATITLAIIISINVFTVKSPIPNIKNVAQNTEIIVDHNIFNDEELLLAYDELYNEGFDNSYDLLDEEQDYSYEDELYEDIAFLENM